MHALTQQETADLPRRTKRLYILIFCLALAAFLTLLVLRVVTKSVDNSPATTGQQHSAGASFDATHATGAPVEDTNTPADRTVPDPDGGNANTILSQ